MSWMALVVGAYLLGAVPSSLAVVWAACGVDVRVVGSGNPGATNVLRVAGVGPALLVLLFDCAKGAVSVLAAFRLEAPAPVVGGAAVAAVAGHVFPPYLGFRGGKGVATAVGALGVLAPLAVLSAALVFVAIVATTRFVSLGSLGLVTAVPILASMYARFGWVEPVSPATLLAAAGIAGLVAVRHAGNIRRLRRGTERRLGEPTGVER